MASASISIREKVAAASARLSRVKRLDRLATVVITLGGLAIVLSVSFIFVFIATEAWPLLRPASGSALAPLALPGQPLLVGGDEYQLYAYAVVPDGRILLRRTATGEAVKDFFLPGLDGARVTAASRSQSGEFVAAGTSDGRVLLSQVRFLPRYEKQRLADLEVSVAERGAVPIDPRHRPLREASYLEQDGKKAVAALVADDEIAVALLDPDTGEQQLAAVQSRDGERFSTIALGRVDSLAAGSEKGHLYHWDLSGDQPRLTDVVPAAPGRITALAWAVGGVSVLVGDDSGRVSAFFRVRQREDDEGLTLVRGHELEPQGAPVIAIAASSRDKSFAVAGTDGSLSLRHLTSERTLLRLPATGARPAALAVTPKGDAVLVLDADGRLGRHAIDSPHPEVSWRALFGKVWYEGYPQPEYVWQSTGATSDFEPKLSLVPLVFGTIKATVYAMLFAVPIAILGALYASQFVHPSLRAKVKPLVEIMAALPSVVIGFIAGLWLASRVEARVVPVLLMVVVLPAFGTAGVVLWDRLPQRIARRLKPGTELALILPLLALGAMLALALGPAVESAAFGGDFRQWLVGALSLVYDQRNSLVVGLAMGFAVIPIIFTISEDSFSSVPAHLTAASLALGASRWQTAVRVVLPTASPGVFSAVMIGFGRAVGETMIVLMATGNTPVMDWSLFNGMRTLSANIAVEMPEAPYGGTLYRVLFLAALVLFGMTFVVNTVAEVIRQRLRERYRAL